MGSGDLPGAVHNLTAARIWGIVAGMTASGMVVLADKGYLGAGEHICTPYGGRNSLLRNRTPTGLMPGSAGLANAPAPQLKSWRILRQLGCRPWRAGQLATAIRVLQTGDIGGWKGSAFSLASRPPAL